MIRGKLHIVRPAEASRPSFDNAVPGQLLPLSTRTQIRSPRSMDAQTTAISSILHKPYICSFCGSKRLRAYQVIHDTYTSRSVTWKGIIFKHGYSVKSRSSKSAIKCAPPRRPSFRGCNGYDLRIHGRELSRERFHALVHGPVVLVVGSNRRGMGSSSRSVVLCRSTPGGYGSMND
jgi:hypothetical protein